MLTDWLLVRRAAAELDRAARGARIRGVGRMPDGRLGLAIPAGTIAIDAFGPTPIVTLEAASPLENEAGWIRASAEALGNMRIGRVRARRGDRVIAIDASAQSRFGVTTRYRLVAELVPRFGNVVVLKDDTIVAAAKEFTRAENAVRATVAGDAYEPPPLELDPTASAADLAAAFDVLRPGDARAAAAAARTLRGCVPLVPRLLAESLVAEALPLAGAATGDALAARTIARAEAIVSSTLGEPDGIGDVFVYREGDRIVQCHTAPLAQLAHLRMTRVPALLPVLAEAVGGATQARAASAFAQKRAALLARVERRRAALAAERAALERERADASERESLRIAGELLYAYAYEIPPGAASFTSPTDPALTVALDPELDAKGNAAAMFRRYKKATGRLEHAERRLLELERDAAAADEVAWELGRADPETLEDTLESVERLERRTPGRGAKAREHAAKRKPLDVRIAPDARILVGRSPRGNVDLTFRIARPDDLWFHVRGGPGAHVVLQLDGQRRATPDELEHAAALAAYHSKARATDKVDVDYTERKHVRKQQNAAPGLVWYTGARTLLVAPAGAAPAGGAGADRP